MNAPMVTDMMMNTMATSPSEGSRLLTRSKNEKKAMTVYMAMQEEWMMLFLNERKEDCGGDGCCR